MKKIIVTILSTIVIISLLTGCSLSKREAFSKEERSNSTTDIKNNEENINVGFNVRGSILADKQCNLLRSELEKLKKENVKTDKIWLRIQGGTISQKTYSSDWDDKDINSWAQIQKDFGCQYIFIVNFNDTSKNQMDFYKRLTRSGMKFKFIELGNEQYLAKFKLSKDIEYEEVTKRTSNMTAQKYIDMCNEYIDVFKSEKLPFYVQFAGEKEENSKAASEWNKEIINAINTNAFSSQNVNGSIHLYERGGYGSLNTKQLSEIRKKINRPILFGVTESGVVDESSKLSEKKLIDQETNLTKRLLDNLQNGDLLLNHVLFIENNNVFISNFNTNYNGITQKGKAIFEIFKRYWY